MFDCSCFATTVTQVESCFATTVKHVQSGLLIKILPICFSSEGIAGHQFQNTEFPQSVFRLVSREFLDQHTTPLGDHMLIFVNFLKTGNGYANRNKKVPSGISGDLLQNIFCP